MVRTARPSNGKQPAPCRRRVARRLWLPLLAALWATSLAHADDQAPAAAGTLRSSHAARAAATAPGATVQGRVELLAKALDLDANQQLQLQQILQSQREQVRRIWSDSSVAPAYRIAATLAASDRAGDAIRAMLNDEQKQKYNLARPPQEQVAGFARPDVAEWMGSMQHE